MTTALITHPDCLNHITPQGHPERVARLEAILQTLDDPAFADLQRHQAPLVSREALLRAHPAAHIEAIAAAAPDDGGWRSLDADTHMSPGSLAAAQRGAGGSEQSWTTIVATHANLLSTARSEQSAASALDQNARSARDASAGVDIDRETADLVQLQQAYEASARIIQVARETLQSILAIF